MVDAGIGGGNVHSGGFSAGTLFSDGVGLPAGRAMANGDIACLVVAVGAYLGGRNGSPTGSLSYAGQTSGAFQLPNIGAPTNGTSPLVGPVGIPNFLSRGGSTRLQWNGPNVGPAYPGRGGGGSVNGPGWSRAGTMGGVVRYAQAPVSPTMYSATSSADGRSCTTSFGWAGDDGGAGLLAYRLQRADDAGFTVNVATITVGGGSNTMTGLTPGKRYYWRAAAINSVTESAGALGGPWSNVVSNVQNQPALGRINVDGSGFTRLLKGSINRTGAGWVPLDMKVNTDGTSWKNSGY